MLLSNATFLVALAFASAAQQPALTPPCASAEYRQLDFWVGTWDIEFDRPDGTIGKAENVVTNDEYGSCVITERFRLPGGGHAGADYRGTSYSIYDRQTKTWRQMWVDSGGNMFDLRGGPVTGESHVFELVNIEPRGPEGRVMRMIWEDVSANALTWRWQAREPDGSWVDRWVLRYRRRGGR